ncbi:hypothetical protein Hanom_Chr03g00264211 [Helianthus anomalus]
MNAFMATLDASSQLTKLEDSVDVTINVDYEFLHRNSSILSKERLHSVTPSVFQRSGTYVGFLHALPLSR